MGLEGGGRFGSHLFGEEYFRNPELSPNELEKIFKPQGGYGEPVLLEPSPQNLMELFQRSRQTFYTLLAASLIPRLLNQDLQTEAASLIGGVGAAALQGELYREHDDIDILIPRENFTRIAKSLQRLHQVTEAIFRTMVDPMKLLSEKRRSELEAAIPHVSDKPERVRLDIFVYNQSGLPYAFGNRSGYIRIGNQYPLHGSTQHLLGLPMHVAPRQAILSLKNLDSRPKGRLDFQKLQASRHH